MRPSITSIGPDWVAKRAAGAIGEIARSLVDPGDAVADPEHAVGQEMEIAGAGAGVGAHAPLAVLDIEADRREIGAIHAGVHREAQRPPVRRQLLGERGETAVGLVLGVGPIEADVVAARVEAADRVARRIEVARRTGRRGRRRRSGERRNKRHQRAERGERSRGRRPALGAAGARIGLLGCESPEF